MNSPVKRLVRSLLAVGAATVVVIAVSSCASGGRQTQGSVATPRVHFGVLDRRGPSGIIEIPTAASKPHSKEPVFISKQAEEGSPDITTARELRLPALGIRVWVAAAYGGGICVLEMRIGHHHERGPASSCSAAEVAEKGVLLLQPASGHTPGYIVGVAPDGIPSVLLLLANGSAETVPVHHNVYSTSLTTGVESVGYRLGGVEVVTNTN